MLHNGSTVALGLKSMTDLLPSKEPLKEDKKRLYDRENGCIIKRSKNRGAEPDSAENRLYCLDP